MTLAKAVISAFVTRNIVKTAVNNPKTTAKLPLIEVKNKVVKIAFITYFISYEDPIYKK